MENRAASPAKPIPGSKGKRYCLFLKCHSGWTLEIIGHLVERLVFQSVPWKQAAMQFTNMDFVGSGSSWNNSGQVPSVPTSSGFWAGSVCSALSRISRQLKISSIVIIDQAVFFKVSIHQERDVTTQQINRVLEWLASVFHQVSKMLYRWSRVRPYPLYWQKKSPTASLTTAHPQSGEAGNGPTEALCAPFFLSPQTFWGEVKFCFFTWWQYSRSPSQFCFSKWNKLRILTPLTSQSTSQLQRHFYRRPLYPPSSSGLWNSTSSKQCHSSHHPDSGVPWVGAMWRWAAGTRKTRDSSALALNSLAPDFSFLASFVEGALLQ